jgi:3-hydroxyisobutyrate dehydrogenase
VNNPVLGFFGLGRMGAPIARRIAQAGYRVVAFDLAVRPTDDEGGIALAGSPDEVAAESDIVLLSLPDGAAGEHVCAQIVQAKGRRACFVVDLSTIGIRAAHACATLLNAEGMTYVDAPVSGGVAGAQTGALTMMVAVDAATFAALRPLLEFVAQRCFHVGTQPGQGQAMKLLNNFVSATALAATSEAAVFGSRFGLDLSQMIDVLNASSGRTTASSDKFPMSVIRLRLCGSTHGQGCRTVSRGSGSGRCPSAGRGTHRRGVDRVHHDPSRCRFHLHPQAHRKRRGEANRRPLDVIGCHCYLGSTSRRATQPSRPARAAG